MARICLMLLSLGWYVGWCTPFSAFGAIVAKLEVVNDGSSKPPGDRLDISILFLPGDEEVTLEIRAFYRQPDEDLVKPLLSEDATRRGKAGEFFVRLPVPKPTVSRGADLQVVMPYAALSLPNGEHEMAYEIRGLRGDMVDFVRATPMVLVKISDRNRKTMVERASPSQWGTQKIERDAYVLKNGVLEETKVQLEVAVPVQQGAREIKQVDIRGEFSHPLQTKTAAPRPDTQPSGSSKDSKLEALPLANVAWQSLEEFEPESKRLVFFATNRKVLDSENRGVERFGKEISDLTYGSCLVNIPIETHTAGKLEVPSWWQHRDPEEHFLVETVAILEKSQFLAATDPSDLLLFVHGFNTNFEFCALRTAQIVHDLRFPGKGIAFSWPSAGSVTGYFQDQKLNEASVGALVEVLRALVDKRKRPGHPNRRIHVISHSMGNRLFLKAARQLELETANEGLGKVFGHIALAAPDVDASTFSALLPSVIRQAEHVTFYYCQSDRALTASRAIHVDKPVGLGPFFADGLDTINADQVNTEILGHGYFASANQLLLDLHLLVRFNLAPDQRHPPLSSRSLYMGYPHWMLALPR